MAGPYIPGRVGGDNKVLGRWQKYASDNSYHEKSNGNQAPKMQGSEGRMTSRVKTPCCGPRAEYAGAKDDLND